MTKRAREAALRIALIGEEFSAEEISEAISLLNGLRGEDLLNFLLRTRGAPKKSKLSKEPPSGADPYIHNTRSESRTLQNLRNSNPQKYELLRDFERQIQQGELLPSIADVREFGDYLSQGFSAGKSRKEALERLMTLLSRMDFETVRVAISKLSRERTRRAEPYQKLADFIISGTSSKPKDR